MEERFLAMFAANGAGASVGADVDVTVSPGSVSCGVRRGVRVGAAMMGAPRRQLWLVSGSWCRWRAAGAVASVEPPERVAGVVAAVDADRASFEGQIGVGDGEVAELPGCQRDGAGAAVS